MQKTQIAVIRLDIDRCSLAVGIYVYFKYIYIFISEQSMTRQEVADTVLKYFHQSYTDLH